MDALRVFIVDDDQDFAESLALLIEGRGYQVEVAFSGEEAIAKFREQDFDITFMDVRLPGKNGTESFL
jgi:CheY-like chemotaxis protein